MKQSFQPLGIIICFCVAIIQVSTKVQG